MWHPCATKAKDLALVRGFPFLLFQTVHASQKLVTNAIINTTAIQEVALWASESDPPWPSVTDEGQFSAAENKFMISQVCPNCLNWEEVYWSVQIPRPIVWTVSV